MDARLPNGVAEVLEPCRVLVKDPLLLVAPTSTSAKTSETATECSSKTAAETSSSSPPAGGSLTTLRSFADADAAALRAVRLGASAVAPPLERFGMKRSLAWELASRRVRVAVERRVDGRRAARRQRGGLGSVRTRGTVRVGMFGHGGTGPTTSSSMQYAT